MAFSAIQPFQYVALRLPSDQIRVEQILPNTHINLGKYGSFRTNQILGRPYHLTFEILDRAEVHEGRELRVVPASELDAMALDEQAAAEDPATPLTDADDTAASTTPRSGFKSNVNTHDDPANQKLSLAEIEALKESGAGSGRALIEKMLQSHVALDQKTAFSLAKYTLRKRKKYMRWFCVLPLDVATLVEWLTADREFARYLELRNDVLGLVGCWANVHAADPRPVDGLPVDRSSRYLVVDDTGGLVVAAMAERMGILHQTIMEDEVDAGADNDNDHQDEDDDQRCEMDVGDPAQDPAPSRTGRREQYRRGAMDASSNAITMVHANQQPNLGLLRYFNFEASNPTPRHPLYTHLKTLSWLQLLDPASDLAYREPAPMSAEELAKAKSNKRSAYYRKRRRWQRVKAVVDETRAGQFDGLVVASFTDPVSIVRHLIPLLAGGSQIVVYSPTIEPLVTLADYYSTARRSAFLKAPAERRITPSEEFPLDPTLVLAPMLQTARVREWQVLPGRTHPLMTGRGGAEGYVFVGTRVLPVEGRIEARGRYSRGKKARTETDGDGTPGISEEELAPGRQKRPKVDGLDIRPSDATPASPTAAANKDATIMTQPA